MNDSQKQIYDKIETLNSLIFNIAEVYYHISDLSIFLVQCVELKELSLKSGISFNEVKEKNKNQQKGYFNYPSLLLFCQHSIKSKGNMVFGSQEQEELYIKTCEQIFLTVLQYSSDQDKIETLQSMKQYKNSLAKVFEGLINTHLINCEKKTIEKEIVLKNSVFKPVQIKI